MRFDVMGVARPLATLVLRLWLPGQAGQSEAVYLEATHVQTGQVTYFKTIDSVAQHIEGLARQLASRAGGQPPIYLPEVRRRSENHD